MLAFPTPENSNENHFHKSENRMKDFNYNQLISFVEVALYLNISTAAQHLNRNRATISEHIESLEFELGHKLFDRSGRKLKLTAFGERILRPSVLLTRQIYTWQTTVEKATPDASSVCLRLAYDRVIPSSIIKDLIHFFHSQSLEIECISISSNLAIELLEKNSVDLIITPEEEKVTKRDLEWQIIGSMPYRFYAHKDFFNSDSVDLSQLLNKKQILPNEYLNKSNDEKFIFTPNNIIINDVELLKDALILKMGWAFLPKHLKAESWDNIIEFQCSLGREGFVTPVLARWRPGQEVIVSPILKYFEEHKVSHF